MEILLVDDKETILRVIGDFLTDGDLIHKRSDLREKDLDNVFQPFFTTKPEGKGTGLGLPIVKNIVERHSGAICVRSRAGVGTQFTVTLPVYHPEKEEEKSLKEEKSASTRV